jgi:hypothetical protein
MPIIAVLGRHFARHIGRHLGNLARDKIGKLFHRIHRSQKKRTKIEFIECA